MKCCSRCGSVVNLERHHILPRSEGGVDDTSNEESLCRACHDYVHAWRLLEQALSYQRNRRQLDRIKSIEHRLSVLENLNTPKLILDRQTYLSYWVDVSTHYLPRIKYTQRERVLNRQIDSWVKQGNIKALGEMG